MNPLARKWDVSGTLAERPFLAAAAESGAPMFGLIGRASVERRFARVFGERPEGALAQAIDFLLGMVDAGGRDKIAAMTGAGPAARQQR